MYVIPRPPSVQLLTTSQGSLAFGDKFPSSGKVLLPLLTTNWSHQHGLPEVLEALQQALSGAPFTDRGGDQSQHRVVIRHQTIKTAVLEALEKGGSMAMPSPMRKAAKTSFEDCFDYYLETCKAYFHLDGQQMMDIGNGQSGTFQFASIMIRLRKLKTVLEKDTARFRMTAQPHYFAVIPTLRKQVVPLSKMSTIEKLQLQPQLQA